MASGAFFNDAAKAAVKKAVERVESQTSAELVVTVRRQAGESYREADFGFGAFVALVSLVLILFLDREFSTVFIPVDIVASFAIGALICRSSDILRRLFTARSRRAEEVRKAACAAFQDLGIGRTRGRTGIVVLVALFERKTALVADVGVDTTLLEGTRAAIAAAVDRVNPDFDAFIAALESIGPALEKALPRGEDDVNELPDDMR